MLTATGKRYTAHRAGPDAWEFFFHNAGWSYKPGEQSELVGRMLCALVLARAELLAYGSESFVTWEDDYEPAEVWNEETGDYDSLPAVVATLYKLCEECPAAASAEDSIRHCERKAYAHVKGSLCGITESDDYRERDNYRRVVEAELACEAFS